MNAIVQVSAVSRASRRTRETTRFMIDAAAYVRANLATLPDGSDATLRRQAYAARLSSELCELAGFEVRVRGSLPGPGSILVCNHVSWQDPILVASVAPSLGVAKHEVGGWPLVGGLARGLDFMLVDRRCSHSGARVLLRSKTLLERGASILSFPEGTTTDGDDILPFRRGMFGLARRIGAAIVPITLRYLELGPAAAWVGDASFFPHFLATVARPRTIAQLEFGAPIHAEPSERPEQLAERTRAVMRATLSRYA